MRLEYAGHLQYAAMIMADLKCFATWIAELLTANQASAIHARDIIEDLVAEYDPELPENDSTLGNLCRD